MVLVAAVVAAMAGSCSKGCSSCSPLAKATDPLAMMPDDSAVLVQMDVAALENDAIFRTVLMSLWEKKGCLVNLVLENTQSVTVTMADVVPDSRTLPRVVIVTRDSKPEEVLECLEQELFPDAGSPHEETYRDVTVLGYPERSHLMLGVVNRQMLILGDRDGLRQMVDTFLDGKPSMATSDRFAEQQKDLPEGAQVTLLARPGPVLQKTARSRFKMPWAAMLDATEVTVGLVFRPSGLRLQGVSATNQEPADIARSTGYMVENARNNRFLRIMGIADLLADVHVTGAGGKLRVKASAPEKALVRVLEDASKFVEIGL